MAAQLQTINGIATVLIAFIAGLALNFERLGRHSVGTTRIIATTLAVAIARPVRGDLVRLAWLPVAPEAEGLAKLAMAGLFVIVVISFSPTMTAAVISETGARGRLSDLVLAIVVTADLVALVLFSLGMQFARLALRTDAGADVNVLVRLAWEIGGALAFGSLVGALFGLYLRYVERAGDPHGAVAPALCSIRSAPSRDSNRCWRQWPPEWSSRTSPFRRATR